MEHGSQRMVCPEDAYLASLHLLFIVFSYTFAIVMPWFWGAAMIVAHASHEKIVGDCALSRIQKQRGHSGPEDDYFFHLFNRLGNPQPRTLTARMHLFVKGSILLIVVGKLAAGFL